MRPEWSIIILTVLAGVAEGVFALTVGGDLFLPLVGESLSSSVMIAGSIVAVVLAGVGTLASFFHLHHKERGVKAILKWKFSWLSREVILLPVFIGFATLYGFTAFIDGPVFYRVLAGIGGVVSGVALGVASGMIYYTVRFIREWANAYTPVNFIALGMATGGVTLVAIMELTNAPTDQTLSLLRFTFGITFIALILKVFAYQKIDSSYTPTTSRTALGFPHPEIMQTDNGAAYGHYNTKEYFFTDGKVKVKPARLIALLTLFFAPMVLMMIDYMPLMSGSNGSMAIVAALIMIAGGMVERWLFFVEGNHLQNYYYGNFPGNMIENPITTKGSATAPLPPN